MDNRKQLEELRKKYDLVYDRYMDALGYREPEGDYYDWDEMPEGPKDEYEEFLLNQQQEVEGYEKELDILQNEIFKEESSLKYEVQKKLWNEETSCFQKGTVLGDSVSVDELEKDIFDRKKTASSLADMLCSNSLCSPYNVAILGGWGTGKTTFMEYLRNSIKEHNAKSKKVHIVDFNAADYSSKVLSNNNYKEHVEQQWSNLLKELFKNYEKEHPFKGAIRYNFLRIWKKNTFPKVFLYFLTLVFVFGVLMALNFLSIDTSSQGEYAEAASIFEKIVLFLVAVGPVLKYTVGLSESLASRVSNAAKMPNYEVLGSRENISYDVDVLLKAWLKPGERIIVLVDDCDRCSHEGIMELFESMHLFLGKKQLFFVFSIDPRLLNEAVAKYYGRPGSNALVEQFLQKYVAQCVTLNLPDYSKLVASMRQAIEGDKGTCHCLTDEEYKLFEKAVYYNPATPRSIKRLLNNIVLLKNYYMSSISIGGYEPFIDVMAWYLFNYYYTDICAILRGEFENNKEYEKIAILVNSSNINMRLQDRRFQKSPMWEIISALYIDEIRAIDERYGMFMLQDMIYSVRKVEVTQDKEETA